jgi:hypothetical protein
MYVKIILNQCNFITITASARHSEGPMIKKSEDEYILNIPLQDFQEK